MTILDLWPPILQEIREFQKIAEIEDVDLEALRQELENIVDDQFIQTATERGIARREKILRVTPFADDTLDSRRFRIRGLWNEKLPYTYRTLIEKLDNLCGADGYVITLDEGEYSLNVKVELTARRMLDAVSETAKRMLPANIAVTVELRYNQYSTLSQFTHTHLATYTHNQLRNEVI